MDPKRVPQRPNPQLRQPAGAVSRLSAPTEARSVPAPRSTKKNKKMLIIGISLILVAILVFGALNWLRVIGPMAGIKTDKFQAVFLANSQAQVYFGKITSISNDTIVMKDVYYIKSQNQDQQDAADKDAQNQAVLTKIDSNSELHKPYNEMRINRDQVLFWENLQDDSKIVQTIKNSSN